MMKAEKDAMAEDRGECRGNIGDLDGCGRRIVGVAMTPAVAKWRASCENGQSEHDQPER